MTTFGNPSTHSVPARTVPAVNNGSVNAGFSDAENVSSDNAYSKGTGSNSVSGSNPVAGSSGDTGTSGLASTELRYLVLAAQREGSRQLNRYLSPLDLTASQAEIILVLSDFGPLTLKDLGGLIVCESGSPSRIVDALVKRGLVAKNSDPSDRRAVTLTLTKSGAGLVPQLSEYDKALNAASVDRFAPEQLTSLVGALRTFLEGTGSAKVLERRFADQRVAIGGAGDCARGSASTGSTGIPARPAVGTEGGPASHARTPEDVGETGEYPQDLIDAVTEQVLARLAAAQ